MSRTASAAIILALCALVDLAGQVRDSVPAERLAAREWYRDAKFGMFIHWGVYSLLGQGEWVMQNRPIPVGPYESLASTFNPVKFDARAWVSLAKSAGMRYITITARHHDGFSMFATRATPYNIVDWTPFQRDPLKELAEECRREGIKLFFYYSQLDWHHRDYWPRGRTGRQAGRPDSGQWGRYLDFMDAQLTELLDATREALAHYKGEKLDLRTTVLPEPPEPMTNEEIKTLRESLKVSQAVFARYLNVSTKLVQAWEGGIRRAEGAALRLLKLAEQIPILFTPLGNEAAMQRRVRESLAKVSRVHRATLKKLAR